MSKLIDKLYWENMELQKKNRELEDELKQVRDERLRYELDNVELKRKNREFDDKFTELNHKQQYYEAFDRATYVAEIERLRSKDEDLKKELARAKVSAQLHNCDLAAKRIELEKCMQKLNEYVGRNSGLLEIIKNLRANLDILANSNKTDGSHAFDLKVFSDLQRQLATIKFGSKKVTSDLGSCVRGLAQELALLQEDIKGLWTENEDNSKIHIHMIQCIETLRDENTSLKLKNASQTVDNEGYIAQIGKLKETAVENRATINKWVETATNASFKIKEVEEKLEDSTKSFQRIIESKDSTIAALLDLVSEEDAELIKQMA